MENQEWTNRLRATLKYCIYSTCASGMTGNLAAKEAARMRTRVFDSVNIKVKKNKEMSISRRFAVV